jgi:glutamate--cysteine ligase
VIETRSVNHTKIKRIIMLETNVATPHLNTPMIAPLSFLEQQFIARREQIEQWFVSEWQKTLPPVYGSVDLRNAGFKLAPIDMNLFPAGFNNLNPNHLPIAVLAAKKIINNIVPGAKKILIIPENHTRNLFYWANIQTLQKILAECGFETRLGMLSEEIKTAQDIVLASGEKVHVAPLQRVGDKLVLDDFEPEMVLLNNDLSEGIPDILQHLSQPLLPPAELGWSQRLKSEHFQYYAEVAAEFSKQVEIDSWLIAPLFRHCGEVDFMQQEGLECLIHNAEILFSEIQHKYAEYQIPYEPFLIVKADAGTYGMAVMTVRNIDELKTMNRKQRTRMSMTKGSQPVRRVIIQEGVYTFETVGEQNSVAEPVVYLWGECVVGGFYRVHAGRGVDESLNAPGMHFEPIAFAKPCNEPCSEVSESTCPNRFYLYGIVARLSMLAAAREIKDQLKS